MPVYPFKCWKCRAKFELHTSVSDYEYLKDKVVCLSCGSLMGRVFTPFAIHGFENPNQVGRSDDGEYDTKKDIALTLEQLESKGRLDELSKDDVEFYQEYVKP